MASQGIVVTTSDDIFFEINGMKIAGVQSYNVRYTNDVKTIDAFGQSVPIGFTLGTKKYSIDITKVYLEDTAISDGIDFFDLSDLGFNFVVVKKGRRTVYKNCVISDISEDGSLKSNVAEKITLIALDRIKE